jgi:hypothetical protein
MSDTVTPAPLPTLMVVPWHDELVDAIGFDPRSSYVELYWLNVLGPTATWLFRRLVGGLDTYPHGYELDLTETAKALGLGYSPGTTNPFLRALQRCVLFGVAQEISGGIAVRRRVPPVAARHLARMPPHLRAAHAQWERSEAATRPDQVVRARLLADAMVAAGDDDDVVERQLLGLGVPPLLAAEVTGTARTSA